MSRKEIDRLEVVRRVLEGRLSQVKAAELIGLSTREVRRLCTGYEQDGPMALASRKRGRPSNHRLPVELELRATSIVRELYGDFGPTLAQERVGSRRYISHAIDDRASESWCRSEYTPSRKIVCKCGLSRKSLFAR
jgi:hypothetical protein